MGPFFEGKSSDFLRNGVLNVQEKCFFDGGFNFYR